MSHSSSLKARRKRQKIKKLLHGEVKLARRQAKIAAAGPKVKKPKVKREKPEKEKKSKAEAGDAKKPRPAQEPQAAKKAKKGEAGADKPPAS